MRIAVLGANGQLGSDVCDLLRGAGGEVLEWNHDLVDVADRDAVLDLARGQRPDAIVNTAAFHHLEQCEERPDRALAVNTLGARNVAEAAVASGARLIHVSTDYVFDGSKNAPYLETDLPRPLNVYGISKLAGEHAVRAVSSEALVLRTSGLYGHHPCRAKGRNFVELMLFLAREGREIKVVDNEFVTPTPTLELARQIAALIREPLAGLCHATSEGQCSWYDFAAEIFRIADLKPDFRVAGPDDFPMKTPRPTYSVLENRVLKGRGVNVFTTWQEGLREYLAS